MIEFFWIPLADIFLLLVGATILFVARIVDHNIAAGYFGISFVVAGAFLVPFAITLYKYHNDDAHDGND